VELPDGCADAEYLDAVDRALDELAHRFEPGLVLYLAGADPHEGDRLGRLKVSFDGLMARDRYVIGSCREVGIPVCATMSGGYGRDVNDTVAVHLNTVRVLRAYANG